MKSLVEYINEMSLEQLDDYITKTLKISYDQAHKFLSKYDDSKYVDDEFEDFLNEFIVSKEFVDGKRIVNIINKLLGLEEVHKQYFIDYFEKNQDNTIGLPISSIFGETIFSSKPYNIFNTIISSIKKSDDDVIPEEEKFRNSLKKLSKETLPGAQAAGPYELLLKLCIAGKVEGKGDVGMAINGSKNQNLQLEVKFCNGCNFMPFTGTAPITTDNFKDLINNINNDIKNNKDDETNIIIGLVSQYINVILDEYKTKGYGTNDKEIINFLTIYFNEFTEGQYNDEIVIKNCIAIYFMHLYLLNQFKNIEHKYLILFNQSTHRKIIGNYIYVDASKYQNKPDMIKNLINFFKNNLYVSRIYRGKMEIKFQN